MPPVPAIVRTAFARQDGGFMAQLALESGDRRGSIVSLAFASEPQIGSRVLVEKATDGRYHLATTASPA